MVTEMDRLMDGWRKGVDVLEERKGIVVRNIQGMWVDRSNRDRGTEGGRGRLEVERSNTRGRGR